MKKYILPVIAIAAITSAATLWGIRKFTDEPLFYSDNNTSVPIHYASNTSTVSTQPVDFTAAAQEAVKCVVHITTLTEGRTVEEPDPYDPFGMFGMTQRIPAEIASGSGVLVSPDGYIVTNNHVVQGATKVKVTFDNRNQQIAKVVGTDPATDLAVLKIDGSNFPYMTFGNSDSAKLGQWVLAVGYPLNLDVTVTAGIISGKSRSIQLPDRSQKNSIEAYIQTDAAVNPGNSGGPLVNTDGQLIGINSAIASPTGSYAGYSYAIPSNIVRKVAEDIIKHGHVMRGYLGVAVVGLNNLSVQSARQLGLSKEEFENATGVFVSDVLKGSAAEKAGIQKGDFITAINGVDVNSSPQLVEQVALFHPGDKLKINFRRGGKDFTSYATLQDSFSESKDLASIQQGGNNWQGGSGTAVQKLGAQLQALTPAEAQKFNLDGGVKVVGLSDGILKNETTIQPGFVISSINGHKVKSVADVEKYVQSSPNKLRIAGSYPGQSGIYYFGIQNG